MILRLGMTLLIPFAPSSRVICEDFNCVIKCYEQDFALVNIAAAIKESAGTISDVRVACGGVECVPKRLDVVEAVVKGSKRDEETAKLAGQSAIRGATPLNHNHFKIPLMENLVMRAIRDA